MAAWRRSWCFAAAVGFCLTHFVSAADFDARIRPLLKTYCNGCHSAKAKKGGLDLQRFANLKQVRADIEPWQSMLEMLETNQMPPQAKRRPKVSERRFMISWIRGLLDREAKRRSGDPGPLLLRRLNNVEYRHTIRDLTGVDIRPGRKFSADGAAGEGFLNAASALTISPDQLVKYLDAGKETARHVVFLPNGFRFSRSKFREDWVNEVIARINGVHQRYGTKLGGIPVDRYIKAIVTHRKAIRAKKTSIEQVAVSQQLSARYLRNLWQLTNGKPRASIFLTGVRERWQKASLADVPEMAADIYATQGLLWHKRSPSAANSLSDRFVPASASPVKSQTFRLGLPKSGDFVIFLHTRALTSGRDKTRVVLHRPRFEGGKRPPLFLREVLKQSLKKGTRRIDPARFGRHPQNKKFDQNSVLMRGNELLQVRIPRKLLAGRTFVVELRLDPASLPQTLVQVDVRRTLQSSQVDRGLRWQYREVAKGRKLLALQNSKAFLKLVAKSADEFRQIFPARVCYPGLIVRDTVVTLERFHRGDSYLSRLLLSQQEHKRLDRLWEELHYISGDALQVKNSIATLTQGEMRAYKSVQAEIVRRAAHTEKSWLTSQPSHLKSLKEFASRAYRRPLTDQQHESLLALYRALRKKKLQHRDAMRSVLARIFVSPSFLFRFERQKSGKDPQPVSDWELATRLSYFFWSSLPDKELRELALARRLRDPQVLAQQARRMLRDSRSRALAIEFGTQWLEVRRFDRFQGKDEKLFPAFDAKLRKAMYEESILFFHDMFRADRPFRQLLDSDHTFVNERLAKYYGIGNIKGAKFRRVAGVKRYGRGGILGLSTVLAKHSGAARTSPVLRGNWIAETLLGDKLPRPPKGVPELPKAESGGKLTIRQLVERHASMAKCAVCHQRIDPLGFALEQFDTIGRRRSKDMGGRPIDAHAKLKDGTQFEGIEGLRRYLLSRRQQDFRRQFCKKLLGYALGRRVILSDRQLLNEMTAELGKKDARISAAVLAILRSRQFQTNRGSEFKP